MFYIILSILSDIMAIILLQLLFIYIFGATVTIGIGKRAYTYSKGFISMAESRN